MAMIWRRCARVVRELCLHVLSQITLGWLMVPWGVLCTILVSLLHNYNTTGEQYREVGSLQAPLLIYGLSVVIEMAAEPAYLLTQVCGQD